MKRSLLWILAVLVTIASAVYQRLTGPTVALKGKAEVGGIEVGFKLERSAENLEDYLVNVQVPSPEITGIMEWKKFKTEDPWQAVEMRREGETLSAPLPKQPMAGKVAYRILLARGEEKVSLSGENPVVLRFKGPAPDVFLIPHIVVMFLAMLISTRGGLEALRREAKTRKYAFWTVVLLFAGGFILGPIIQKYSFGDWWTGFPLGFDLTDNKILIALAVWVLALVKTRKEKRGRWWVFGAAVLTLAIYLIPHSLLGSELDYSAVTAPTPLP